jgi:drug/metabolite transporter (DMT)-like permease
MAADRPPRQAWVAWIAVCLIWGTTYLAIKIALETIPPFLMGGLRYLLAGVVLAVFVLARGGVLPDRRVWPRIALMGGLMIGFGNGGVVWGAQYLTSGLTAVLIATSPFWMVSVDAMVTPGQQFHWRHWVGLGVGFAGILLLVWPDITRGGAISRNFAWGVVAIQIACAGWAVGSALARRDVPPADVLGAAALQMVFGGLLMLAVGSWLGEWPALHWSGRTSLAFVYLTVAGSVVAFTAYAYALRHLDVAIVSLYSYINPIIAVALGAVILGEPVGVRMIAAAAVIILGVVIVGPARKT